MTKKIVSILTGLMLLLFVPAVQSQLLVEDFDYGIGSLLTANGWTAHSGSGTQAVDVTTGLSVAGYKGSDIGGAANIDNNGEDVNKTFTPQTTGNLFVAAILKIDASGGGGYFFHLGLSPWSTTFFSRIWVNSTGDGIGITTGNTAPSTYTTITPGVPFLLVLKLDFAAKKTNMYVLSAFAASEPLTPATQIDENYTSIGGIALRQYNAGQRIVVDGIRIANTWADAVAPAGVVTKVSTPNFSPGGGSVVSPVQVAISSATEGSTIYYTLDGSTPDNTKTQYTAPITVSTTTTVKAIAYKSGLDASNVASATYSFPTEVSNIAALRANTTGLFKLTGEALLTFKTADRNAKYIQDATGGILIDDASGLITTNYAIGDGITGITGTLGVYAGMLQFIPVANPGAATSTGNSITPKAVELADVINHPGQLVKVSGVTIDGEGVFAVRTNYNLNGGTNPILRTAYNDLPYLETGIPTGPQEITGVVLLFNTTAQLVPRSAADFKATVITEPTLVITEVLPLYGVNMGQTMKDTIYVDGFNLTGDISISLSGDGAAAFAVSPATLTPANGTLTRAQVIITFQPATAGDHVASLTFSGGGAANVVKTLTGKAFSMTGDGTVNRPFTVSDVIAMNNSLGIAEKYWVKGYVLGNVGGGTGGVLTSINTTAPFSNTSLVLANGVSETNLALMVPVQLPLGAVRTALNLLDNPGVQGKEILVFGTLEAYFSTPGVRNVTEFTILTALEAVDANRFSIISRNGQLTITAADDATVEVFNAVGQLIFNGRLTKGQNIVNIAQSGLVIVKIDSAVKKVLM